MCVVPRHSRTSRVPAFKEIGGADLRASLASASVVRRSSLRMIEAERPPSSLSWSLYVIARINRSRESRIGGGARCSRRHSPRSSKIVSSESRANVSAKSMAALAISATAPRLDAVTASVVARLGRCQREAQLLFHRAREEPAHAVLLPNRGLHHLFDSGAFRSAQQREHTVLFGRAFERRLFGAWGCINRLHRRLGGDRNGCSSLTPRHRVGFAARLFGCGLVAIG